MENTESLTTVRERITEMSGLVLSMLRTTFAGFMEHDLDMLAKVLKDENRINDMERLITLSLVEISKAKAAEADKKNIMHLTSIVADLEEVGDYIKDIIERVEIKIQERLLFSDEALNEYKHLHSVIEAALSEVDKSLKMHDKNFAKRVMGGKEDVDNLIQKYRTAHTERLMSGICDPRAGNMFLNILDFTGQIFHHTKNVAKSISELK